MKKVFLPYTSLLTFREACAHLKLSPGISDTLSTDLHRNEKKFTAAATAVEEDSENIVDRYRQMVKDQNPDTPEDELVFPQSLLVEMQKSISKLQTKILHEVEIKPLLRKDFPIKREDFGSRTLEKEGKDGIIKNTVYFYDHFLELLDTVILDELT